MKKTAKRLLTIFLILLVVTVSVCIGGFLFTKNYVILNGKPYSRSARELDFQGQQLPDLDTLAQLKNLQTLNLRNTGLTLGEHEWLHRQLPDCDIAWEVDFQGRHYLPDATGIRLETLTESDLVLLDYLPQLQFIDARGCQDWTALGKLVKSWPNCCILYSVDLGGKQFGPGSGILKLEDVTAQELQEKLPALPAAQQVQLSGKLPAMGEIRKLQETFPDIRFDWLVKLDGKNYLSTVETMDLALGTEPDLESLPEMLGYFPNLQHLNFQGTLATSEQRDALAQALPQVDMNWEYSIGGVPVPLSITELDLSGNTEVTLEELENALPYLPDLQKVILCDCGFENEALADLNARMENVKIVWNVDVGGRNTRTDELYFTPNKWGLLLKRDDCYNLRYCTDMVCVDIGHARDITDCEWAAFMPNLKYLILADGNISDLTPLKDLKKLEFLEIFLTPVKDLTPLLGCTALKDLNLCYTYADPAPVAQMTGLERLWWSGHWAARDQLADKLPDTEKNFLSPSSTGGTWRQGYLYYEMRDFIGMDYMIG